MPKIVVTPVPVNQDKYTRRVSVEMTEAEWEAFKGFAAATASAALDGSLFYSIQVEIPLGDSK